jgi:hypothetical protein
MANIETRSSVEQTSPKLRRCVSNGTRLFSVGLDGRSSLSRRFRDIVADIASDLGGYDQLSEIQRQLVRRIASLAMMAEAIEADLVGSRDIDVERYGQLCDRIGPLTAAELEIFTSVTGARGPAAGAVRRALDHCRPAQRQKPRRGRPCGLARGLRRLSCRLGQRRARHRGSDGGQHS